MDKNTVLNKLLSAGFHKLETSDSARTDRHLMSHSKSGYAVTVGEDIEFRPHYSMSSVIIETEAQLNAVIELSQCVKPYTVASF